MKELQRLKSYLILNLSNHSKIRMSMKLKLNRYHSCIVDKSTVLPSCLAFLQLKKYGKDYCEENVYLMEKEAYRFEELWYQIVKRRNE